MHRPPSRTGSLAKIVKICDKTDGISARIGRTFKEPAAIFGKPTETCEQTVRLCGRTRGPFVRTGNNYSMMNVLEPTSDYSYRTDNRCGTTVKTSKAIVRISKPIDRTGIRIGRTIKETVRIGEPISKISVAATNNRQATVDRVRFAIREWPKTRGVGDGIPRLSVSSTRFA
jgi:hypothetical protein